MGYYLGNEHKYWLYLINCCKWKGMSTKEIYTRLNIKYDVYRRIFLGQPFENDLFRKLLRLAGEEESLIEKNLKWIENRQSNFAGLELLLNSHSEYLLLFIQSKAKMANELKRNLPYPFYAKRDTFLKNGFKIKNYKWVKTCKMFKIEPIETLWSINEDINKN